MTRSTKPELWIDYFPEVIGAEKFGIRLTNRQGFGAYLVVVFTIIVEVTLSGLAKILYGDATIPLLTNPFWLFLPLTLLFCIWSIRRMRRDYQTLLEDHDLESRIRDNGAINFNHLVSPRSRLALYLIGLILYIGTFTIRGTFATVADTVGPVIGFVKNGMIIPFVYIPIGAEFAAIYIGIHFHLPRRIRRAELKIDFTDPMNFGGMYYFGKLMKHSYYTFIILTVAFLLWIYTPRMFDSIAYYPYPDPGIETTIQFSLFWGIGTVFLIHSVWSLHKHMAEAKYEKLQEINERILTFGDDNPDIPEPDKGEIPLVLFEHYKLRRVRDMREYPFDAEMTGELMFSVLLPLIIERILYVFS